MFKAQASCHCGNIGAHLGFTKAADFYHPRVCDCNFCRKHGASYVSDPEGTLSLQIKDPQKLRKYQQGSGNADFLICSNCGVLVAVVYQSEGEMFATINSQSLDDGLHFGPRIDISPKSLNESEKTQRWRQVGFQP